MKSIWTRRVLIGLAVVVLLLVAAGGWFVATFDANRYKGLAIDWMKQEHNRTLAIGGPIELSLFPRIEVKLSQLRLSERGGAETFATLDEAGLAAELLPLLRSRLVVDRVSARGLHVVLIRNAKGKSNVEDLLGGSQSRKAPPGGPSFEFDVSRVQLDNLRATLRDDVTPLRGEVTVDSLKSGRLAPNVETAISLAARLALIEPAVNGDLNGETRLTFDPSSGSAKLTQMKLAYKGDALGASAIEAVLRGALAHDAALGSVQAAGLLVEAGATFGNLKLAKSRVALERFHYQPSRKTLAMSKLQIDAAGARGQDSLAFALDWPQLEAAGDSLKGSAFNGRFSMGGATSVDGRFESGPPAGNYEQIRLPGFTLAVKGKSGARQLDGTLKSDLLLRLAGSQLSFDKLALAAQVVEPSLQPLALAVRGSAAVSSDSANWKLDGQLAANNFESAGSASFGKGPPNVQMQARFDSLDLNKLLAEPGKNTPPAKAGAGEATIDLSGLRAVNGKFALRAARFAVRQYRINDARIDANLDNGALQLVNLSGNAWGGSIDASGVADSRTDRIGVKLNANNVNVNALLKDVASSDRLEGTGRVSADLAMRGKTVAELRSRLSGGAALQLRDGAINGINLAQTFRQAKAVLRQDTSVKSNQAEQTDFTELSATFKIVDGVARSDDLDAKSPFLRLAGAGAVDIARERVDYTLRATVTETSKGQGGADLAALKGVTVPVVLSGPLDAVAWRVQWSAVAAGALRGRIEDKLRERLGERLGAAAPQPAASAPARPEDRLKERLRGIFK